LFAFPEQMTGLSVLDVGSATGFFTFEFERRGADVVSIELPSIRALDVFPGETLEQTLKKFSHLLRSHSAYTEEQIDHLSSLDGADDLYERMFDGPFTWCHRMLASRVRRHYSTIYDLSIDRLGQSFDLVFVGDVLLHTIDPLKALAAAASVCRGTLIVAQETPAFCDEHPVFLYVGGDTLGQDSVSWWWPNRLCLEQLLRRLKFSDVRVVGYHTGLQRPAGGRYRRTIFHATR
jgi:SAM-dependent methyltransferase